MDLTNSTDWASRRYRDSRKINWDYRFPEGLKMATTTFSGPIKSGTIKATTGTAIGELKNTGTVATQQVSVKISHDDNASGSTGIVVPANSMIFAIEFFTKEVFTGSNTTELDVGTSADSDFFVDGAAVSATATGGITSPAAADRWINIGTSDVEIYASMVANSASAGELYIVVTYIQDANIS